MGRRGLDVAFARSEPALRCRVVTGREDMHSVTLESVGAVQISKTTPPRWPLQNTAHILQGWGRRTPNWAIRAPWRLTERRIASGHAPRAQNCPRSRLGRSECLRRPLGAANAAWSVGAAGAKTGNCKGDAFARSCVHNAGRNDDAAGWESLVRRQAAIQARACVWGLSSQQSFPGRTRETDRHTSARRRVANYNFRTV